MNLDDKSLYYGLFEKKFKFTNYEDFSLPDKLRIFEDSFEIEKLENLKSQLNNVKNKLNKYTDTIKEWSSHTFKRNPSGDCIIKARYQIRGEFVTQAWCKFFELLNQFSLVNKDSTILNSFHLCEGPGAFVSSLNHFLKSSYPHIKWNWLANTLNPFYSGNEATSIILDDRFIKPTIDNWEFGVDCTGNIMDEKNVAAFEERCKIMGPIHLITADGSINCFDDPEHQETKVAMLHLSEALIALRILATGGNFVLKMFTFFEHQSVNLMYLLLNSFESLYVFKPATSKEGNSEVYVVGLNYNGYENKKLLCEQIWLNLENKTNSMFPLNTLPTKFVDEIYDCANFFMNFQIEAIENNILSYGYDDLPQEKQKLKLLRSDVWHEYCSRYNLKPISMNQKIIPVEQNVSRPWSSSLTLSSAPTTSEFTEVLYYLQKNCLKNDLIPLIIQEDENFQFKICTGRECVTIFNSKFVNIDIFWFFQNVIKHYLTSPTSRNFYEIRIFDKEVSLNAIQKNYKHISNYDRMEKKMITIICNLLMNDDNEKLCIEQFPLFTQFIVGFIYYLSAFVFKEISVFPNGGKIFFSKKYENSELKLIELLKIINSELYQPQTLLGFICLKKLFNEQFLYVIEEYNQYVCLNYCQLHLELQD